MSEPTRRKTEVLQIIGVVFAGAALIVAVVTLIVQILAWLFPKNPPDIDNEHNQSDTVGADMQIQPIEVYFDTDGGTEVPPYNVYYNEKYGNLPLTSKEYYKFDGWYTVYGNRVTADSVVETDCAHTLYARWIGNTTTVEFSPNGGIVEVGSKIVQHGSKYGSLPNASRSLYHFDGWFTSQKGGTKIESETLVAAGDNQVLYAHWTKNPTSEWVEVLPADITNERYEIDTQELYRSKSRSVKTVSEKSMVDPGWNLIESSQAGWGNWSDWTRKVYYESDTRQVNKRDIAATYKTQYNYSRYVDKTTKWTGPIAGIWSNIYCGTKEEKGWSDAKLIVFETQYSNLVGGYFDIYGSSSDPWYNEETRQVEVTPSYTEYQYRDAIFSYTYEKWDENWSEWTTSKISEDADTKVETLKMWCYTKK